MDPKLSHFLNNDNFKEERKRKIKKEEVKVEIKEMSVSLPDKEQESPDILTIRENKIVIDHSATFTVKENTENFQVTNDTDKIITSLTYSKRVPAGRWLKNESDTFFDALSICGTDFTMINRFLPSKTRKQIKNKFLNEEKKNPHKIAAALNKHSTYNPNDFKRLSKFNIEDKENS
ncbi:putative Myb-like DNA binding protein [Hamiltosporidium tvaerminnensis]|uniref:Putative Myb-like DNA binding protein n=1 Tax=Hamiltosporidium tvaerminnensis TaxID=1176355 RepID=A0A4V2JXQ0_9MICR|nr:putative Myb-like DNA binding protein [Hamiltosporidium tvaerminnensis]